MGKCKRWLSLLCMLVLMLSLCQTIVLAADNKIYGNIDSATARADVGQDIKVMTFNVLQGWPSSSVENYANSSYTDRLNYTVKMVEVYSPDVVGFQEAADKTDEGAPYGKWATDLKSKMNALGYTCMHLVDQGLAGDNGNFGKSIASGLMICFKTATISEVTGNRGAQAFDASASYSGYTFNPTNRAFQWIKLKVKSSGQQFYVFNTHMSIPPSDVNDWATTGSGTWNETVRLNLGYKVRTQEAKILSNKMQSLAGNTPVFATGDYNSTLPNSYAASVTMGDTAVTVDSTNWQLKQMSQSPHIYYRSCFDLADLEVMTNNDNGVDQIFVNENVTHVLKLVGLREAVNGSRGSDHTAYVAYCNFTPYSTINTGKYNKQTRTHTDKTAETTYTFDITNKGANLSYKIYNEAGTECTDTVTLTKTNNKFTIQFYIGSTHFSTVNSTITCTTTTKTMLEVEGAENQYFANGAYQIPVKKDVSSLRISVLNGGLYSDAAAKTKAGPRIDNIASGITTYYIKTEGGEIFPCYIKKETGAAEKNAKTLYLDDDIGENTVGTVAWENGKGAVYLVQAGTKGFATMAQVAADVNKGDGRVVYVAPGVYSGRPRMGSSVTILGPNHNTQPFGSRDQTGSWDYSAENRGAEAYIEDGLYFSLGGTNQVDYITVKGLYFRDDANYGHLRLDDGRSTSTRPREDYIIQLDIQNNVFKGYDSSMTYGGFIISNNAAQKRGLIFNNLFEPTRNQDGAKEESGAGVGANSGRKYEYICTRGIFMRNINGLEIASNSFANLEQPLWLSSETKNATTDANGHASYTISGNRFEACIQAYNMVKNIRDSVRSDIVYTNNMFIRCGVTDGKAIAFDYTEQGDGASATEFNNCTLNISGNRFYGCERSIGISRHKTETVTGDLRNMKVNINRNIFQQPFEGGYGSTIAFPFNYRASASIVFNLVIRDNSRTYNDTLADYWDLGYNYFYSKRVENEKGATASHLPSNYVNKESTTNIYNTDQYRNSFKDDIDELFAPYYTSYSGAAKLSGLSAGSESTFAAGSNFTVETTATSVESGTAAERGTVTVLDDITSGTVPTYSYDGRTYRIKVSSTVPGATVSYIQRGTNSAAVGDGAAYTSTISGYKNPEQNVKQYIAYRISAPGYADYFGNAALIINSVDRTSVPKNETVVYNGLPQKLTFTELDEDTNTYTYNGKEYDEMPAFTDAGVYTVVTKTGNPYYADGTYTATLTIKKADNPVTVTGGYEGAYDGTEHPITVTGQPTDIQVLYSVNGGEFTPEKPAPFKNVTDGVQTVTVRVSSNRNYNDKADTVLTYNITPAAITGLTLTGGSALKETGDPLTLATLSGTTTGLTVKYSVNGGALSTAVPTALRAGNYTVAAVVTGANYKDLTLVTSVTVAPGTPVLKDIFNLNVRGAEYFYLGDNCFFRWTFGIELGTESDLLANADTKITGYGMKYAASANTLEDYRFYFDYGKSAEITALEESAVKTYAYAENTEVTKLYEINHMRINTNSAQNVRYAMFYVTYEIDGVSYTEMSDVYAFSNLPGFGEPVNPI